mgnify:CR=1 FL=1
MAIRYKALTELYRETQRSVTAPGEGAQIGGTGISCLSLPQLPAFL